MHLVNKSNKYIGENEEITEKNVALAAVSEVEDPVDVRGELIFCRLHNLRTMLYNNLVAWSQFKVYTHFYCIIMLSDFLGEGFFSQSILL